MLLRCIIRLVLVVLRCLYFIQAVIEDADAPASGASHEVRHM